MVLFRGLRNWVSSCTTYRWYNDRRSAIARPDRRLIATEFQGLADVPPEREWFANIDNPQTRRAYQNDLQVFSRFVGIHKPERQRCSYDRPL